MEKFVRIFSLLILFQFSTSFGQTLSLKIDENTLVNQHADSLNYVLSEELSKRGYFGGKLELINNDPEKLTYTFLNETKVIDDLLFHPSISINDNILENIFSPMYKMDQTKTEKQYVRKIRSSYPFIPENVKIQYGLVEDKNLGALIDFTPDFNSHFSGIIGANQNNEKKWDFSGEIDIRLENTWETASATEINWKRYSEKSQYTRVMHEEPYPFGWPFGAKFEFSQNFRDGNYVLNKSYGAFSVINKIGKWYLGGTKEELNPTEKGDSLGINSFHSESFRITFSGDYRNDRWLPTNGSLLDVSAEVGEINNKGITSRFNMLFEKLFSLSSQFSVQIKFRNTGVWNSHEIEEVHEGQKIFYGGHSSIRGYQEDIFRDDFVSISNLNILFIPNNNMQLYPFIDMAFNDEHNFKYSSGIGLRQLTKNSLIEISFGWPKDEAFSAGKVHVKFTSLL